MHDTPLNIYLKDIMDNPKFPQHTRELAQVTLEKWNNGIIPSQKTLLKLNRETTPPSPCTRMKYDGACPWLRKYGAAYKLAVPPSGERALCCYQNVFDNCPGYKK